MLRIDDIPQQVADDIHAFGVIGIREYENLLFKLSLLLLNFLILRPLEG